MINIVGPYPPPYGGVSVHISRMVPYLKDSGISFRIVNQYRYISTASHVTKSLRSPLWWIGTFLKPAKYHFHVFNNGLIFYFLFLSRISKHVDLVITFHNERILKSKIFPVYELCLRYARIRKIICVSKSLNEAFTHSNIESIYLPAYVPPRVSLVSQHVDTINFLKDGRCGLCIATNIWSFYSDKCIREYGLDLLVNLAQIFEDDTFFIFLGDVKTLTIASAWLKNQNIKNIKIIGGKSLVDYLSIFDVFLRPNRVDAFGVSIQEALDCGVIPIASDVCRRPFGAVMFQSGCFASFKIQYEYVRGLSEVSRNNYVLKNRADTCFHMQLIDVYRELLSDTE